MITTPMAAFTQSQLVAAVSYMYSFTLSLRKVVGGSVGSPRPSSGMGSSGSRLSSLRSQQQQALAAAMHRTRSSGTQLSTGAHLSTGGANLSGDVGSSGKVGNRQSSPLGSASGLKHGSTGGDSSADAMQARGGEE